MTQKMLIDATRQDETRVAVMDQDGTLLDYDYENASRKQLKGNIYLAKVSRVEPSLQACFVDYGGNRHGFLAFSEIHPDYFQLPQEDKQKLMEEVAALDEPLAEPDAADAASDNDGETMPSTENLAKDDVEDDLDQVQEKRRAKFLKKMTRSYKIQEVIKKNQIMLIQVVKEERGNKGAAMTTYLSLAGRYCVLMPNTRNGGGVSRKVSNKSDRKKLKDAIDSLEMTPSMSIIIRTAGSKCNKAEIKRDYSYLIKMWDQIRQDTLKATAPALIHEEADLIKRAIRDMFDKDVDEVLVEGKEGHKSAKAFMKLLTPSYAKKVIEYKEETSPLFHKYNAEGSLEEIYEPAVQLRSGGYLVINPTEALVSIDVNSGRATKERDIEKTALKTNLEAAEEVAKQLRLRDLSGLIVIDFIDMIHRSNVRKVEQAMKGALKSDRARVQALRISDFGLMEISRQRLRPSIQDSMTETCPTCGGIGKIPSTHSVASRIVHKLENAGIKKLGTNITVKIPPQIAFELLNSYRKQLVNLDEHHGLTIEIELDDSQNSAPFFEIEGMKEEARNDNRGDNKEGRNDGRNDGRRRRRGGRGRNRNRNRDHDQDDDDSSNSDGNPNDTAASDDSDQSSDKNTNNQGHQKESQKSGQKSGRNSSQNDGKKDQDSPKRRSMYGAGDDSEGPLDPAQIAEETVQKTASDEDKSAPKSEGASEGTPEKTEDEKPKKKPARKKAAAKSSGAKKASKSGGSKPAKKPEASDEAADSSSGPDTPANDPAEPKASPKPKPLPENVEVISGAPEKPKKGWWKRTS